MSNIAPVNIDSFLTKAKRIIGARETSQRIAEREAAAQLTARHEADWAPYLEQIRTFLPADVHDYVHAPNADLYSTGGYYFAEIIVPTQHGDIWVAAWSPRPDQIGFCAMRLQLDEESNRVWDVDQPSYESVRVHNAEQLEQSFEVAFAQSYDNLLGFQQRQEQLATQPQTVGEQSTTKPDYRLEWFETAEAAQTWMNQMAMKGHVLLGITAGGYEGGLWVSMMLMAQGL